MAKNWDKHVESRSTQTTFPKKPTNIPLEALKNEGNVKGDPLLKPDAPFYPGIIASGMKGKAANNKGAKHQNQFEANESLSKEECFKRSFRDNQKHEALQIQRNIWQMSRSTTKPQNSMRSGDLKSNRRNKSRENSKRKGETSSAWNQKETSTSFSRIQEKSKGEVQRKVEGKSKGKCEAVTIGNLTREIMRNNSRMMKSRGNNRQTRGINKGEHWGNHSDHETILPMPNSVFPNVSAKRVFLRVLKNHPQRKTMTELNGVKVERIAAKDLKNNTDCSLQNDSIFNEYNRSFLEKKNTGTPTDPFEELEKMTKIALRNKQRDQKAKTERVMKQTGLNQASFGHFVARSQSKEPEVATFLQKTKKEAPIAKPQKSIKSPKNQFRKTIVSFLSEITRGLKSASLNEDFFGVFKLIQKTKAFLRESLLKKKKKKLKEHQGLINNLILIIFLSFALYKEAKRKRRDLRSEIEKCIRGVEKEMESLDPRKEKVDVFERIKSKSGEEVQNGIETMGRMMLEQLGRFGESEWEGILRKRGEWDSESLFEKMARFFGEKKVIPEEFYEECKRETEQKGNKQRELEEIHKENESNKEVIGQRRSHEEEIKGEFSKKEKSLVLVLEVEGLLVSTRHPEKFMSEKPVEVHLVRPFAKIFLDSMMHSCQVILVSRLSLQKLKKVTFVLDPYSQIPFIFKLEGDIPEDRSFIEHMRNSLSIEKSKKLVAILSSKDIFKSAGADCFFVQPWTGSFQDNVLRFLSRIVMSNSFLLKFPFLSDLFE